MLGSIFNLLLPVASWIINNVLAREAERTGDIKNYLQWVELSGQANLMKVQARTKATEQIERIKTMWGT